MDFLNHAFAQLSDLFRSMTVGARITTALLLVAVVVGLSYLFTARVGTAEVDLMHGMPVPASQLPAMEAAFAKANLHGAEVRGTQILVPRGQEANYMAALVAEKAVPPDYRTAMKRALENNGLFDDPKTREQRMKFALEEELALVISRMTGIESATVNYDLKSTGGLSREKIGTASVSVKPAGNGELEEGKVSAIRLYVAGAIAGLKPEDVTIMDLNNGRVMRDEGDTPEDSLYLKMKRAHERDLRQKILNALSSIPGITVEPTVVLDKERLATSRKIQYDPKAVPWKVNEKSSTQNRDSTGPAGRPGFASQQPNAALSLAAARGGSKDDSEESSSETINMLSAEQVDKQTVGLTPTKVTVSVGIPTSYFGKIWHERNDEPGAEPKKPDKAALDAIAQEETTKIQKHVAALLPPVENVADATSLVTVTAFEDLKFPTPPGPTMSDKALTWLGQYWSSLGIIAVALFSLALLRSMLRAAPIPSAAETAMPMLPRLATATSEAASTPMPSAAAAEHKPAATPAARLRRFQGGGRSLRDELSDLVQEDPDTAANVLKSWIGHST